MTQFRTLTLESPAGRLAAQGLGLLLFALVVMYVLSGRELPMLLAGLAGLFCVWLFRNPHWGVLAIFAFWFIRYSPVLLNSRHLRLVYIIGVLLFVPLALRLLRDREVWVWRVPQVRYLLAIGAIFLVSSVWADYKYPITLMPELDRTAMMAQDFGTHLAFLVFFMYFIDSRRKLYLAAALAVALIVASVGSGYMNLVSHAHLRRYTASFGLGTNPTTFPYVALFGASLLWCFYLAARATRWRTWLLPLLLGLPVMALASGSRTGLLQLVAFVGLLFADRSGGWSKTQRVRGLLLLGCVVAVASLLVPTLAFLRATSFGFTSDSVGHHSMTDRLNTIYAGLSMVANDPIFGVGLGNFLWIDTAYYGLQRLPHNSYLWALAEGGVGVLVLYLMLLATTYRVLRRLEAEAPPDLHWLAKALRINLVLLLVFSLSDDVFLNDLFYFLLAMTLALQRLAQRPAPAQRLVPAQRPAPVPRPAALPRR
jgi:O-Antigen ligase